MAAEIQTLIETLKAEVAELRVQLAELREHAPFPLREKWRLRAEAERARHVEALLQLPTDELVVRLRDEKVIHDLLARLDIDRVATLWQLADDDLRARISNATDAPRRRKIQAALAPDDQIVRHVVATSRVSTQPSRVSFQDWSLAEKLDKAGVATYLRNGIVAPNYWHQDRPVRLSVEAIELAKAHLPEVAAMIASGEISVVANTIEQDRSIYESRLP